MKQLFYIFLIIPYLCFAQLGVNTQSPEALLHVAKKNGTSNLPSLKIDGLEQKKGVETQSYSDLIIYKDGTIKKDATEAHVGNKFYFVEAFNLSKMSPENLIKDIKVINFTNSKAVNSEGQIIIRETGNYAFSFRFYGVIVTSEDKNKSQHSFGKVVLRISAENASKKVTVLEENLMEWLTAPTEKKMSYSTNVQAFFEKGDIVHISLEKLDISDNSAVEFIKFSKAKKENDSNATSFIMYRI